MKLPQLSFTMTSIDVTNEIKLRDLSKENSSSRTKAISDNPDSAGWDTLKDLVTENVSALKELVLTPPRVKMTFPQDDCTGGKRARCLFETPSPGVASSGPSSKTTRALWSPPKLKRVSYMESPQGPHVLAIAQHFPTLGEADDQRDEVQQGGNVPFPRRLQMKPLNQRSEMPFLLS